MNNYLVFREQPITREQIAHRQQHNEREADCYANDNIDLTRTGDNYYFKKPTGNYGDMVQERIDAGELSVKGLAKDAALFSEIIVSVNMEYWKDKDETYKQHFFQCAYDYLKKQFGEENIISCVWHRDEISADGLINEHLHCIAVPTVSKKRYYSKRSVQYQELLAAEGKVSAHDPRLLKSTETQISHSKFFGAGKDEHHRIIYSYSIWQDELLDHLKKSGIDDLRRGITSQAGVRHLSPLQYKAVMDRLDHRAKNIVPDIITEETEDGKVLMDGNSYNAVMTLSRTAAKQTVAYDEAVEIYVQEQKKLTDKKNEIYQAALLQSKMEYEEKQFQELKKQAQRLQEENSALRSAIQFIKQKVQAFMACFENVVNCWIRLRTDSSVNAPDLMTEIDQHIRQGINIINDTQTQGIAVPADGIR